MSRSSEFGRGYATCLRQFTFHRARLREDVERYAALAIQHPTMFASSDAVEIWASGASDHLSELRRPRRGIPAADWKRAQAVADLAFRLRWRESNGTQAAAVALMDEAQALLDAVGHPTATLEDCLAADRLLGLAPIQGDWSCSEDLVRR